jgi:hypothetical protein
MININTEHFARLTASGTTFATGCVLISHSATTKNKNETMLLRHTLKMSANDFVK